MKVGSRKEKVGSGAALGLLFSTFYFLLSPFSLAQATPRWAPIVHTHARSDVINLVTDLAAINTAITGKEPSLGNPASNGMVLSSTAAGVRSWVNPPAGFSGSWNDLTDKPATFPPAAHGHTPGDITMPSGTFLGRSASGDGIGVGYSFAVVKSMLAIEQTDVAGLTTALAGKQNTITTGTTAQYFRGDLTLATLNTTAVTEGTGLYFTNARAIAAPLTGFAAGAGTITASDTVLSGMQKLAGNLALRELSLGNPTSSGMVLSSTNAGVRSWVTLPTGFSGSWNDLSDKPATFPSSAHGHVQSEVTDLVTALAAKQAAITTGTTAQYFRGDLSLATFPTALSAFTNDANFITSAGAPVQSVAGRTGAITLAQADIGGLTTASSPTFAGLTLSGAITGSAAGLALNAGGTNQPMNFGTSTLTTSQPFTFAQTWNAGAIPFTAVKVNATSTASAASSFLLDLQLGGTSKFKVNKTGAVEVSDATVYDDNSIMFTLNSNSRAGLFNMYDNGFFRMGLERVSGKLSLGVAGMYVWGTWTVADTGLARSAAGVVAVNTGTAGTSGAMEVNAIQAYGSGADYPLLLKAKGTGLYQFAGATNSFPAIARNAVNGFTLQSAAATATWNDASTAASGTVANRYLFGIAAPTLTATNAVTNTVASTVYIGGAPTASTNTTIGTAYALHVATGDTYLGGNATVGGTITASKVTATTFFGATNTPAQITADTDDYNPGTAAKYQRWSVNANDTLITGLTFNINQVDGQEHVIINVGSETFWLRHDQVSNASNRFLVTGDTSLVVAAGQSVDIWYDGTLARWRVTPRF